MLYCKTKLMELRVLVNQTKALTALSDNMQAKIIKQSEEITELRNTVLSNESQLREKDHFISMKDEDLAELIEEMEQKNQELDHVRSIVDEMAAVKDQLVADDALNKVTVVYLLILFVI